MRHADCENFLKYTYVTDAHFHSSCQSMGNDINVAYSLQPKLWHMFFWYNYISVFGFMQIWLIVNAHTTVIKNTSAAVFVFRKNDTSHLQL